MSLGGQFRILYFRNVWVPSLESLNSILIGYPSSSADSFFYFGPLTQVLSFGYRLIEPRFLFGTLDLECCRLLGSFPRRSRRISVAISSFVPWIDLSKILP
jgi:hypothetical protein